jgi:hypothetical protein
LPDRKLTTLRDAADYITALPKKESALPEWQEGIQPFRHVAIHPSWAFSRNCRAKLEIAQIAHAEALSKGSWHLADVDASTNVRLAPRAAAPLV